MSQSLSVHWLFPFFFTIKFVGFCQWTCRQRASHTVSKERGGDYHAMASSQGVERVLKESERGWVWLMDGVEVSVMGWSSTIANVSPCTHPSCVMNGRVFMCSVRPTYCLHHELCMCWVCWFVCCVMSSDGVRGVDDAVCVPLSTPKKGNTAHSLVCMWWCASMCHVVWWVVSVDVSVCCGGVAVWRMQKKKGRGKDTVKQQQKGLFPKPLFPFSLFSSSFSSTLFSLPSTLPLSLLSYPGTHLFFMLYIWVRS